MFPNRVHAWSAHSGNTRAQARHILSGGLEDILNHIFVLRLVVWGPLDHLTTVHSCMDMAHTRVSKTCCGLWSHLTRVKGHPKKSRRRELRPSRLGHVAYRRSYLKQAFHSQQATAAAMTPKREGRGGANKRRARTCARCRLHSTGCAACRPSARSLGSPQGSRSAPQSPRHCCRCANRRAACEQ